MPAEVIDRLERCRLIVRVGIGVDNVDLERAAERGITVCNVPDYCIDEVADHTVAMALSLSRDLMQVDHRIRAGTWKITPVTPVRSYGSMTFGTLGFGRIARAVHHRITPFGFRRIAHDPFVDETEFGKAGVQPVTLDDLLDEVDILSLHAALTPETHHILSRQRLESMKDSAVIVNTSRGALIDTVALAGALDSHKIGGAALDVFESEPLPDDHALRRSRNTLLTSHMAWCSLESIPRLQRLAAEEVAGFMSGRPARNPVNSPKTV